MEVLVSKIWHHTTDNGHQERALFLKILNFWAWADKLGRNFGSVGEQDMAPHHGQWTPRESFFFENP